MPFQDDIAISASYSPIQFILPLQVKKKSRDGVANCASFLKLGLVMNNTILLSVKNFNKDLSAFPADLESTCKYLCINNMHHFSWA